VAGGVQLSTLRFKKVVLHIGMMAAQVVILFASLCISFFPQKMCGKRHVLGNSVSIVYEL
jgi:hypothetical protein